MSWYYREGVHAAAAGRDLVLLDLTADAYSCIPEAGSLGSQFDIHIDRLDDGAQALLRDAGLIVSQQPSSVGSTLPQKATRDLVVDLLAPLPVRDVLGVLAARAELRRAGPDPTVSDLLAAVGPRSETSPDRDLIFRLSNVVDRLMPWMPGPVLCLQRSALLRRVLARHGQSTDWVFGVRTWPFRAHCWLQFDDVCLTDDAERLRAYTPILVR